MSVRIHEHLCVPFREHVHQGCTSVSEPCVWLVRHQYTVDTALVNDSIELLLAEDMHVLHIHVQPWVRAAVRATSVSNADGTSSHEGWGYDDCGKYSIFCVICNGRPPELAMKGGACRQVGVLVGCGAMARSMLA